MEFGIVDNSVPTKESKKRHPSYEDCPCVDSLTHSKILEELAEKAAKKEIKKAAKKAAKNELQFRTDRFPRDGGRPIKASVPGYSKIPWTSSTLTLIAQSPDGQIHYAKTVEEKNNLAWGNFKWILVCWPGKYSQDIFLIDDMKEFRKALGFRPRSESIVVDEEGNEWIKALFEDLFNSKNRPTAQRSSILDFGGQHLYNDKW